MGVHRRFDFLQSESEVSAQVMAHGPTEDDVEGEFAGGVMAAAQLQRGMGKIEIPILLQHLAGEDWQERMIVERVHQERFLLRLQSSLQISFRADRLTHLTK